MAGALPGLLLAFPLPIHTMRLLDGLDEAGVTGCAAATVRPDTRFRTSLSGGWDTVGRWSQSYR